MKKDGNKKKDNDEMEPFNMKFQTKLVLMVNLTSFDHFEMLKKNHYSFFPFVKYFGRKTKTGNFFTFLYGKSLSWGQSKGFYVQDASRQ